ncbi:hypothetical protein T492DRAFT_994673 [Pavlovales sp. CCMP2436]|nr:hypothetical protein T492DRAFT_994673 [Pavlovales sp. CCMP2436]
MDFYRRRGDANVVVTNALAAYNKNKGEFGLPVERRSVHYQLPPSTRDANPGKNPGKRLEPGFLPGKIVHAYVPNNLDQSAEYARREPLRARKAPMANGAEGPSEAPPAKVGFGSTVPRGADTSKARDLSRWRERVVSEARALERARPPQGSVAYDADDHWAAPLHPPPRGRVATATAFDMVNGQCHNAPPQCARCGQDRFFCPHKARAAPSMREQGCYAGATTTSQHMGLRLV